MNAQVWEGFYDQTFAAHMLVAPRPGELDFLIKQLALREGDRLLDQCCGNGRISLPLAQRGFIVEGVDQAADYVRQALARATPEVLARLHLIAGDTALYIASRPQRAVCNLYSSFGYSWLDEENLAVLQRAADSLERGGRFVLDTHNPSRVLGNFQASMVSRLADDVTLLRESEWDAVKGMLRQRWTYFYPDGRRLEKLGDCKLYLPHELARMLKSVGLRPHSWFGGFAGEPLERLSERLIVVAEKLC